jgi:hypothetical protein
MAAAAGLSNASLGAMESRQGNTAAAGLGNTAAMGGAGGAPSVPYIVMKKREKTKKPNGSEVLYIQAKVGKEAGAVAELSGRFIYFDLASKTENGFAKDSIISNPPGTLYTWIIKQMADGNKVLIAARTRGAQEIGTLHRNLNEFTQISVPGQVISAGEAQRTATGIVYNLLSGAFMEPIFKESAAVKKANEREIAISAAAEVFGALVGAAIPTAEQLIIPESLPPTIKDNITFYDDNFNTNVVKTRPRTGNVNADASAARMLLHLAEHAVTIKEAAANITVAAERAVKPLGVDNNFRIAHC